MPCTIGGEQEYAIGFSPERGAHPGNQLIYRELLRAVTDATKSLPSGEQATEQGTPTATKYYVFTENGGAFCYERLPYCVDGGLLEASTPECADANELALYLKAQEAQLVAAIPIAEETLSERGFPGKIHLVKTCLDSEGNHFGAQENYEAPIAGSRVGVTLVKLVIGLAPLPLFLLALVAELLGSLYSFLPFAGLLERLFTTEKRRAGHFQDTHSFGRQMKKRAGMRLSVLAINPIAGPLMALFFRPQKRALQSFMITRLVFSGSGSVDEVGRFYLSQKARKVRASARWSIWPGQVALFDSGNCFKAILNVILKPLVGHGRVAGTSFHSRQRFQIGMADANRAPFAEQLKFGTTQLLLDMVEAGWLREVPRLRRPMRALAAFNRDVALRTCANARMPGDGRNCRAVSALEIQRWYLEEAQRFTRESDLGAERSYYEEICRLWVETLDLLEAQPGALIGKVDWITKRYLMQTPAGNALDVLAMRRIDLGYHEIGRGYFEKLEHTGYVSCLVNEERLDEAKTEPPSVASAQARSRFIKDAPTGLGQVFWSHGYRRQQDQLLGQSVSFID